MQTITAGHKNLSRRPDGKTEVHRRVRTAALLKDIAVTNSNLLRADAKVLADFMSESRYLLPGQPEFSKSVVPYFRGLQTRLFSLQAALTHENSDTT
jgi:hypothetical protein